MGATLRGASPAVGISGTPLGGIGVLGGRWMLRGVGPYSSAFSCFGGTVVVIGARDTVVSVIGCDCAGYGRAIPATVARMEHMNAGSAQGDRAPVRKMYGVFCMTMTVLFFIIVRFYKGLCMSHIAPIMRGRVMVRILRSPYLFQTGSARIGWGRTHGDCQRGAWEGPGTAMRCQA